MLEKLKIDDMTDKVFINTFPSKKKDVRDALYSQFQDGKITLAEYLKRDQLLDEVEKDCIKRMDENEDKDAVFQSATNILMHIFNEETEIIASIIKARGNYDVERMCNYLNIVISYLVVCRTNLLRYGKGEDNV